MVEEIPISEVRRVVIHYEIKVPQGGTNDQSAQYERDLAERLRKELLRTSARNGDVGLS
jgi:hypothetical protein